MLVLIPSLLSLLISYCSTSNLIFMPNNTPVSHKKNCDFSVYTCEYVIPAVENVHKSIKDLVASLNISDNLIDRKVKSQLNIIESELYFINTLLSIDYPF